MPLLDTSNPKVIAFLQENYEKEARLRALWSSKHSKKFQKAATFFVEPRNNTRADINYAIYPAVMAATTRDHIAGARLKLKAPVPDHLLTKVDKPRNVEPIMLPVKTEVEELVKESRKEYFKKRNILNPEDKYYYPETENWRYGWRLKESLVKAKAPEYPRVNHMGSSLTARVGLEPDPSYYCNPRQLTMIGICT